uniref:RING finger protein 145-like isoform X2 n=1 Tax=Petromyzon marinus TaxID=7757 RepID=A0AAJ7T0X4_PETMA|nr:RING finger protein 145-like isoform X2 [Petromyzon marinus]
MTGNVFFVTPTVLALSTFHSICGRHKRLVMAWSDRLEAAVNVALRVPALVLLDALYTWDVSTLVSRLHTNSDGMLFKYKFAVWNAFFLGHILGFAVLLLPIGRLTSLYLHLMAGFLLASTHIIARSYIDFSLTSEESVYANHNLFIHLIGAILAQVLVEVLCACCLKTRKVWRFMGSSLPLIGVLCGLPSSVLPLLQRFAITLSVIQVMYAALSNIYLPYYLLRQAWAEGRQLMAAEGIVTLLIFMWQQLSVPSLFLTFWLVQFMTQTSLPPLDSKEDNLVLILTSVAKCCGSPYLLLGLTSVVSHVAQSLLSLCRLYLHGFSVLLQQDAVYRGISEGVMFLMMAMCTGLLELQLVHRAFLLSIILFVVLASTLQSALEISEPVLLNLAAARDKNRWKHFRALSMCLFLCLFPMFLMWRINLLLPMDSWLILISSTVLTALQAMSSIVIYLLFSFEEQRDWPPEFMDDVVYYLQGFCRGLEFLASLGLVVFSLLEWTGGGWSWSGVTVVLAYAYYNLWQRAHAGWRSLKLRRMAGSRVAAMQRASPQLLAQHGDVCPVCYQDMKVAVLTPCGHMYHPSCLRKWFYVQDTCPMCHRKLGAEESSNNVDTAEYDAGLRPPPDAPQPNGDAM